MRNAIYREIWWWSWFEIWILVLWITICDEKVWKRLDPIWFDLFRCGNFMHFENYLNLFYTGVCCFREKIGVKIDFYHHFKFLVLLHRWVEDWRYIETLLPRRNNRSNDNYDELRPFLCCYSAISPSVVLKGKKKVAKWKNSFTLFTRFLFILSNFLQQKTPSIPFQSTSISISLNEAVRNTT